MEIAEFLENIESLFIVGSLTNESEVWAETDLSIYPIINFLIDNDNDIELTARDVFDGHENDVIKAVNLFEKLKKFYDEETVKKSADMFYYSEQEKEIYLTMLMRVDDDGDLILMENNREQNED